MNNVLITGKAGYVALNLFRRLNSNPEKYSCDCLSLRDQTWKSINLSKYDTIVHCAALVHKREVKKSENNYNQINRDLTYAFATKAKTSGVKHFVFISSMAVYGLDGKIGKSIVITEDTPCIPNSFYGKSKLEAENLILGLQDPSFTVSIVRPPMIYGPNCPGNYTKLRKLALHWGIFPEIQNERSMIFIDNLCNYLEQLLSIRVAGIFLPQNDEFVCTTEMIKLIVSQHGIRKPIFSKLLGKVIYMLNLSVVNKVYGNLLYEKPSSNKIDQNCTMIGFEKSICITEKEWI